MTVTEWADRFRRLPETSTSPGQYRSSVMPYVRRPQDCMADPDIPLVVLCWATQTGKSTCIENAIGYRIHRQPAPMIVLRPKIDDAEGWAKERFVPMVRATPVLSERVRLGRSSDATMRYKAFPGGFLFVASAQSATEMASRSAPFGLADEVDRMEFIPGEGNPVEIFMKRQGAADVGQMVLTSTPRDAETTIIWPYLEGGTFERFHIPCPHCNEMQPLFWKGIRWTAGKPSTAIYVCGGAGEWPNGCGSVIEERRKPEMLEAGAWFAQHPENPYPSFHLPGWYSPFAKSSWAVIASEFERARGKPADLQVWINTRAAELWVETAEMAEPDALLERLEPTEEVETSDPNARQSIVPEGVGVLTAGVDVQHNRIEAYVWGWGAGLESWLVAYILIEADPQREPDSPGSAWKRLDSFLTKAYRHASGHSMRVGCALIDTGFATSQVYRYARTRRRHKVYACKGVGGEGIKILGRPTLQGKERMILYAVGVDEAKREFLRSQILERSPGPGFVHLPQWMTTDQVQQLVSEKRVRRVMRGRVSYSWMKKTPDTPNEGLDCRNYARAALEQLGPKVIATLGKLATDLQPTTDKAIIDSVAVHTGTDIPMPDLISGKQRRVVPRGRKKPWMFRV
jgi:phage terminase large subunit GpA-like protein